MLNEFMEKQTSAYNLMINEISNGTITHAYLIDENGYKDSFNMIIAFVKAILCNNDYDSLENQILCDRIDNKNYSELKIIEPDGLYIKKQQIIDLQQNFSRLAVEGKKRIYIIRDCDKMKAETANSMLKFLEEPDNNIIAILMTNNYNNILPTVISRCQVIKLDGIVDSTNIDDITDCILRFINEIECNGLSAIIDVREDFFENISSKDRFGMMMAIDIMIDLYYDILKLKTGNDKIKYDCYFKLLSNISNMNDIDKILWKINYLLKVKDSIKFNININLMVDSLIVNIGGYYEDCRC